MNTGPHFLINGMAAGLTAGVVLLFGCDQPDRQTLQGYVEGEFVYIASPSAGSLDKLHVKRGTKVRAGAPLFELDDQPEQAARDEAERKLAQARANLEDVKKGKRPSEIEALEAQLNQARAAVALADKEFAQQEELMRTPGATARRIPRARASAPPSRKNPPCR